MGRDSLLFLWAPLQRTAELCIKEEVAFGSIQFKNFLQLNIQIFNYAISSNADYSITKESNLKTPFYPTKEVWGQKYVFSLISSDHAVD